MFLISAILFSAVSLLPQASPLSQRAGKGLSPIIRTAKLNYEIQEDAYSWDEDSFGCLSNAKSLKSGTLDIPVYDMTNGGGIRSSTTPIQIELENPSSHASEKVEINFSRVIANIGNTHKQGTDTKLRKFFGTYVHAEDPSTHKSFRTQGIEVYTDDLNTKSIEGWIGVSTPDRNLGEECKGRGFSIWVRFEDEVPLKSQN